MMAMIWMVSFFLTRSSLATKKNLDQLEAFGGLDVILWCINTP